jgi:phenylacetate-CoA ligase
LDAEFRTQQRMSSTNGHSSNGNGSSPPSLAHDRRESAGARWRELLSVVLESNEFQRRRLAGVSESPALEELPLLTKRELIEDQAANPPFGTNLTYPLSHYTRVHLTSGTTGSPLRVLDTGEDWAWWQEIFARTLSIAGIRPGDRVALAFSFGPHVQFWATHEGLQELGAMAIPLGGMTSAQRLRTIADVEATAVACTPTYALRLLEVAVEERMESALESVGKVICTGEPGASLESVRSRIEDGFGARCVEHAGLTEVGPFGYPCPEGGGLHLFEDEFHCEILDSELVPAKVGERGELVLTPLRRTGFPVIRYRTGDVVLNTDRHCPGGHPDRWLPGGIVGRTDDMVVIRGMNVFPSSIEETVRQSGAGEFRLTFYSDPGGMDEIKLEVELGDGGDARRLQDTMRQQLGLRVRIVPVAPGILPRSEGGKTRRVVDERPRAWTGS